MSQLISVKSICAALNSVDEKKEDLREAFENLQSDSSSLASFTLEWKDIEEHFDSMLKSMERQLKDLESKEQQASNSLSQKISPSEIENSRAEFPVKESEELQVTYQPELELLCVNMDGKGLLSLVSHRNTQDLPIVRNEFAVALQSASDPAKLVLDAVLDAMQASYSSFSMDKKTGKTFRRASLRACVLLLEELALISPHIKPEVKEAATKLAVEWKGLLQGAQQSWLIIAFLQLLVTYDLVSVFSADELLDLITLILDRPEVVGLFRVLNIPDKAPDLIEKLISNGKQTKAVKFICAFKLGNRFPPGPLLKKYVKELKKVSKEIHMKGNISELAKNEARKKEIFRLKGVLKCIEEHNLGSQFGRHKELFMYVKQLEEQNAVMKRAEKLQQKQKTGNKRPRLSPSETDQANPYLVSSGGLYGSRGSTPPPFASCTSSSVAPYGLAGTYMGYGGNLSSNGAHFYSSESHTSNLYGGYGLVPQYYPPYYP